jgi:hypothetical protein
MKIATLVFFFLFTQAYARTCSPEVQIINQGKIEPYRTAETHFSWSNLEKQMIHQTVGSNKTLKEALFIFGDFGYYQDRTRPGSNAGSIAYFGLKGKVIAYVRHYPGDNEYGKFFEIQSGSKAKLVGEIHDGDLYCK